MNDSPDTAVPLGTVAKRILHRLMAIGENRFQLLAVEVQEEGERLQTIMILAVAIAALAMLAGIMFSGALVLALWSVGPVWVLLGLGVIYGIAAAILGAKICRLRQIDGGLPATMDQIRKDRACLEDE